MFSEVFSRANRFGPVSVVGLAIQAMVLGGLFWLAFLIFQNTQTNLEERGIESGFEFLSQEAGLPIGDSLLVYYPTDSYGWAFINGMVNTIYVESVLNSV